MDRNLQSVLSRRKFVAASGAASLFLSSGGLNCARAAANERIGVAVVGLGSRGTQVLRDFLVHPNVQILALCDVHPLHYRDNPWGKGPRLGSIPAKELVMEHYASQTKSGDYMGCEIVTDYRQLVARQDLDAVVVATPDHWHARVTLDALSAGKDVYCEKPVTHFFAEGQMVCRKVAEHDAVFQVGSQQRSDPLFRKAVELVRNGHLGNVLRVEVGLPQGYVAPNDDTKPGTPPAELDYDMWCGPAPKLPYCRAWHHRWWRAVRAFGGGVLMDWIGHHNDIAHWGIGESMGGPRRVEAVAWTKSQCPQYDTPADYEIHLQYAHDIESLISTKVRQGTKWIGDRGWLWVDRGKIDASDPRWLADGFRVGDWTAYRSDDHVGNFLECIQSRKPCIASAEIGHRSITPGHLGYVSQALGRAIQWDPVAEQVVNDPTAQELLMHTAYRAPWTL